MTATPNVKEKARHIVDHLADDATWDDLLYQVYVRQTIEAGLEDFRQGRTMSSAELRKRLGLPPK